MTSMDDQSLSVNRPTLDGKRGSDVTNDYTNRSSIALKRASIAALLMIGTLLLTTRASAFINGTAYVVPPDSTT